jgi:hypothetical protein
LINVHRAIGTQFDYGSHICIGPVRPLLWSQTLRRGTLTLCDTSPARPHWTAQIGFSKIGDLIVANLDASAMHDDAHSHAVLQGLQLCMIASPIAKCGADQTCQK